MSSLLEAEKKKGSVKKSPIPYFISGAQRQNRTADTWIFRIYQEDS